jgi:glycosyltransferase involved in cell wall biosynthesis
MQHIVFYEPAYMQRHQHIWVLRGGIRYKSILGDLRRRAKLTILMSRLPPGSDPHRVSLEDEFGVHFVELRSEELINPLLADELAGDLIAALKPLKPTVISNLNGRGIGFCYASAMAAEALGVDYVWRMGGNDLEARGAKAEHLLNPFWGTRHYFDRLVQERVAAHVATNIIVMSERERVRVASMKADASKVHICVRGVDQTHFRPAPGRILERCRRLLFIGRRSLEKGYDILEGAMQELASTAPTLSASFAGTFDVGETGNRRYVGFVDYADLPAVYNAHDALVVCSRSEGFPQVIMEAMSCGLPCILTRGLFHQDFEDGETCLLTDPTPEGLAAVIARLAQDDTLYRQLAGNSLRVAKEKFSDRDNRARYHEILLAE